MRGSDGGSAASSPTSTSQGPFPAEGVPLTVTLTLLDASKGCAAHEGAAVYLWHCDRDGRYSLYSSGARDQNYLRGVQAADGQGRLTFQTILPAAYSGRWPHIHFEVYPSLKGATNGRGAAVTSQLAVPADVCRQVYATSRLRRLHRHPHRRRVNSMAIHRACPCGLPWRRARRGQTMAVPWPCQ